MREFTTKGMHLYTRNECIDLMNRWGGEGRPFLFAVPFDAGSGWVVPADAVPEGVFFQVPLESRMPDAVPLPEPVEFRAEPPDFEAYCRAFACVQSHLMRGDSYLLNLCFPSRLETNLSLRDFAAKAVSPYKLLVDGEFACFSPEAFVTVRGGVMRSFPMKGTIRADVPDAERRLLEDEKERREHATIVDLLRNDLAMVCEGVHVPRFRYVEEVETSRGAILQTSSEVCGCLPEGWQGRLGDVLFRLLPAGSVSGAPKEWTVRAIREAEPYERGFYTGVFGFFDGESLDSAVAIRFVEASVEGLVYRSGGGITVLSDAEEEYRELIDKVYVPFAF